MAVGHTTPGARALADGFLRPRDSDVSMYGRYARYEIDKGEASIVKHVT